MERDVVESAGAEPACDASKDITLRCVAVMHLARIAALREAVSEVGLCAEETAHGKIVETGALLVLPHHFRCSGGEHTV